MNQRESLIRQMIGKSVYVVVDRPVGFCHKGLVYSVNYGYIPGLMAGDGEAQDVYILGIAEPLEEFDGIVIAAVLRKDDVEDKLIAAPEGMVFTPEEIARSVHFVEQYFDSSIVMG